MDSIFNDKIELLTSNYKPETTGRCLAILKNYETKNPSTQLVKDLGKAGHTNISLAISSDYLSSGESASIRAIEEGADGIYLEKLGVAIIERKIVEDDHGIEILKNNSEFMIVEERVLYTQENLNREYLRGYYEAVKHLYDISLEDTRSTSGQFIGTSPIDGITPEEVPWPLQLINVLNSQFTGKGINIAILDTGFNIDHPDFKDRNVVRTSFIENQSSDDNNGHGTHCAGIAAGPRKSSNGARYGVASESNLYAGKVLADDGRGNDGTILDGIEWALENNCKIISMSLGSPVGPDKLYDEAYERIVARALGKGSIIIAAAGNNSNRKKGIINPVNHPANCPSVISVGAIDEQGNIANFSCAGEIDLVAPGVSIRSSWCKPLNWKSISGTSMATPFAAGIAALIAEANPNMPAKLLMNHILKTARASSVKNYRTFDAGHGLVYFE